MNFKGLQAFTRIMTSGTLSAAAKELNISEPALSRQLSLLEAELGLTLFSRDKRRLIPTEEGKAFFHEAERLLDSIAQIPEIVSEIKRGPRRRMRIIMMPRLAGSIAVRAISRFLDERPDVEITVEVQPRRFLEQWVASRQFDLGLGALPAYHAAIETERMCSVPAVAVLHPGHALAVRRSLTVEDLADERLIAMSPNTLLGSQVTRILHEAGVVPKSPIQVSQIRLCCSFVAAGIGVAITDAMIPEDLGRAVRLVPIEPRILLDFGLLYPRGAERTAETRRLVEIIKAQARSFVAGLNFR